MSKYVIAWPHSHRIIKWLYYAEIRNEPHPHRDSYASPSGTKVILRSALISEAYMFDSAEEAEKLLWDKIGYDITAQIKKMSDEDLENAKRESFNIKLGNVSGTSS